MVFWKRRPWFTFTATLFLLGVGALAVNAAVESYVRSKVEALDPDIEPGNITWGLHRVVVHNTTVQKPWVSGTVAKVVVEIEWDRGPRPGAVDIDGGDIELNLDNWAKKPKKAGKKGGPGIWDTLRDVRLDRLTVRQGDYFGEAKNVTANRDKVCCAEFGIVLDPRFEYALLIKDNRVFVRDACFDMKQQTVGIGEVSATIIPPAGLPGVRGSHDVLAEASILDLKERSIRVGDLHVSDLFDAQGVVITYIQGVSMNFSAMNLTTTHPWLGGPDPKKPAGFEQLVLRVPLPGTTPQVAQVSSKKAQVTVDLDTHLVSGSGLCQEWASGLPEPKPEALGSPGFFEGNLGFEVKVGATAAVKLRYDCKAMCSHPSLSRLKGEFTYEAYRPDGKTLFARTTGRGTQDWVPIGALPLHMTEAVKTLEDPSFDQHRGILTASLKLSLEENLKRREFFRGGSTISQQLAKNIWLHRDKTVTRKAAEALMTMALESCFSKAEILELYLNVVEFAPDVYGIGPGAKHYFDKHPADLTPEEAYYLADLLPHPKSAVPPNEGGLDQTRTLMASLAKRGLLPEDFIVADPSLDTSGWVTVE
jgi:hypothetical protein